MGQVLSRNSGEPDQATIQEAVAASFATPAFQATIQEAVAASLAAFREEFREELDARDGFHYASIGEIWGKQAENCSEQLKTWASYREKDAKTLYRYKRKEFPAYDTYQLPEKPLFPNETRSAAHLIPKDVTCSLLWLRPLSIVTGYGIEDGKLPVFSKDIRDAIEGGADNTIPCVKDSCLNRLILPINHEPHYDKVGGQDATKQLLLGAVWDPTKEWNSQGYKLVVAATPETYQWLMGKRRLDPESDHAKWLGVASLDELKLATSFLSLSIKAVAELNDLHWETDQAMTNNPEKITEVVRNVDRRGDASRSLAVKSAAGSSTTGGSEKSLQGRIKSLEKKVKAQVRSVEQRKGKVFVPVLHKDIKKEVLTVDLGEYFKANPELIPDPYLVELKCVVGWTELVNQKLLPGCDGSADVVTPAEGRVPESISFGTEDDLQAESDDLSISS